MASGDGTVRAYVPLRKKLKSAHTGHETNFVASYSAAYSGGLTAAESQQQQEASWTRLEHGITIAHDSTGGDCEAPPVVQSFEKMGLPGNVLRYVHLCVALFVDTLRAVAHD